MTIYIHNTLSRQKEEFRPIDAKNVRVYFCGPTVYNYAHIGNARAAVVFDLLVRVMRYTYGKPHVRYVSNITDIDDRIIDAAKQTSEKIDVITKKFSAIYNEDMAALGVSGPDYQPRATEYIPQMLAMIDKLIKAGHAYEAEGHVLFDVPSWPDYGRLSRRNRDDMIAGARVEVAPYKKDPADFVLWKPSTPDQPGWDSPYGRGRPGWHLECSAMNEALNGNHFDIHAGGEDLIFPHHENEIAQSVCAHGGEPYVNYWMHNGHLMVEGQKMSKSVGNVLLVHDLIQQVPGEVIRYALLSAHYRQPFDWTKELLQQSARTLDRYYGLLRDAKDIHISDVEQQIGRSREIVDALENDLNTPLAFASLSIIANRLKAAAGIPSEQKIQKIKLLMAGKILGLLQQDAETWFKGDGQNTAAIEKKVAEMQAARQAKDYKTADALRDLLRQEYSVSVSASPTGITWRKES
ncbi:MAG: cysteine--tRNA ligase [Proteobacteria bacterium]|nr:cysteine--tRNA ligase [Pseudomonadota bacterium]